MAAVSIGKEEMESLVNFELGSNTIIAGPTSSGKTSLLYDVINQGVFTPKVERVYVCAPSETCASWRKTFDNQNDYEIFYVEGSKNTADAIMDSKFEPNSILIFDDFTKDLENKTFRNALEHVFHVLTHHVGCWTFFITHDLFTGGLVSLRRNAQNTFFFDVTADMQATRQYINKLVGLEYTDMFLTLLRDAVGQDHGWIRFDRRLNGPKKLLSTASVDPDRTILYTTDGSRSIF